MITLATAGTSGPATDRSPGEWDFYVEKRDNLTYIDGQLYQASGGVLATEPSGKEVVLCQGLTLLESSLTAAQKKSLLLNNLRYMAEGPRLVDACRLAIELLALPANVDTAIEVLQRAVCRATGDRP